MEGLIGVRLNMNLHPVDLVNGLDSELRVNTYEEIKWIYVRLSTTSISLTNTYEQ
jgi:hypothetical protein